jgi:cyclic pyranopterin phosphate synthase
MMAAADRLGRALRSLRVSVTDRCNLRCRYCMPEENYVWLPRRSILSFEETDRLVKVFAGCGVSKVRLTGGEPLLRHDLPALIRMLGTTSRLNEIALTTNGVLLADHAATLQAAGLHRVTVSLDTLRPERMQAFARSNRHADVIRGIRAARDAGLGPVKINSVMIRGFNDDELEPLLDFGRTEGCEVRFIEYMDVGGANSWRMADVVTRREMLDRLARRHGGAAPVPDGDPAAPAERFQLADGTRFGIIASTSEPFCRTCDRGRLTADGHFLLCLYAASGLDLLARLRAGTSDAELESAIASAWRARQDRGAEERAAVAERGALYSISALRADPHKEMHTRGG